MSLHTSILMASVMPRTTARPGADLFRRRVIRRSAGPRRARTRNRTRTSSYGHDQGRGIRRPLRRAPGRGARRPARAAAARSSGSRSVRRGGSSLRRRRHRMPAAPSSRNGDGVVPGVEPLLGVEHDGGQRPRGRPRAHEPDRDPTTARSSPSHQNVPATITSTRITTTLRPIARAARAPAQSMPRTPPGRRRSRGRAESAAAP